MTYFENYSLYLGDSGYTLRPWLMTPLTQADPDTPEERYKTCFKHTRSIIERCNGLLKMRFRWLLKHRVLHYSLSVAGTIVNGCTILHNLCVQANLSEPEIKKHIVDFGVYELQLNLVSARRMRQQIIIFFLN